MKRVISLMLLLSLLICGCSAPAGLFQQEKQYDATFLTLFDTVTTIKGYAESSDAFEAVVQPIHDELLRYHQLFDIYNAYEGVNNLKTVNDNAGISPVEVDAVIIELLKDCKEYYSLTGGRVNVAMGSVLCLWHDARNDGINDPANAALPDNSALEDASEHTDIDNVVIDETTSTVYLPDPDMRLDVGAIAKGWAIQKACANAPEGLLISVGGNVCATGPKSADGSPWVIGIQDPDSSSDYLHTLYVTGGSVVTSGDYQRSYMVDGKMYHHIIDPDTLYPSGYWSSVSIVCSDSGLADALSTALFLLSLEDGQALLDECGAEAMWVDTEGKLFYSPGFQELIRT